METIIFIITYISEFRILKKKLQQCL